LQRQQDIEVVATVANGQETFKMAQVYAPEVIVMDISMPELDGIRAAEEIRSLQLPRQVTVLSMHLNAKLVQQALNKGVGGYVLKQQASGELPQAVRSVSQGNLYVDTTIPAAYLRQDKAHD
jgi:two-component system nitrate/nitrite response regulator NarL